MKQICDVAAQHARRVYSSVGDFRRGIGEERKKKEEIDFAVPRAISM